MKISVITMMFPRPSEAFAGVEVRSLIAAGADVRVHSLRGKHRLATNLVKDWGIPSEMLSHLTIRGYVRGIWLAARRPLRAARVLAWLALKGAKTPQHTVRAILLLPRMLEICEECDKFCPDVVHAFWGHFPGIVASMYAEAAIKPSVVSISMGAYDLSYGYAASVDVARCADVVWTHAEVNRAELARLGIEKRSLVVQPRGIDLGQQRFDVWRKDSGKVVCISRLEKNKGVDDCLRAFASGSEGQDNCSLIVIGEGPELNSLGRMAHDLGIQSKVTFLGAVPHSEVYAELASASIFMLMSRSPNERLPNSLKEAMVSRCICIVTETLGIYELVGKLDCPLVVNQGDWLGAAEKLRAVLMEGQLVEADRDIGRQIMMSEFDAAAVARNRIDVWGAASSKRNRCLPA